MRRDFKYRCENVIKIFSQGPQIFLKTCGQEYWDEWLPFDMEYRLNHLIRCHKYVVVLQLVDSEIVLHGHFIMCLYRYLEKLHLFARTHKNVKHLLSIYISLYNACYAL